MVSGTPLGGWGTPDDDNLGPSDNNLEKRIIVKQTKGCGDTNSKRLFIGLTFCKVEEPLGTCH